MPEKSAVKYHILMRAIHWLMAIIVLSLIGIGWYMTELEKDAPIRDTIYFIHKSFGVTILLLFFVRVTVRLCVKVPTLPLTIPVYERIAAHTTHFLIYLFIFIVPLSGYMMSNMFGMQVNMFGIHMPQIFAADREMGRIAREAHEILPYLFLGLIFLHVAGALKHKLLDKNPENDVLKRML